jgi:effector-binding domain-containing protein
MTVDFGYKQAPSYRVATLSRTGAWSDQKLRGQYKTLADWAKKNHLSIGRWFFFEPDVKTFVAGIEVKGKAKGSGSIRLRTIPASPVASVVFNPEEVSPRVVYHGISDWLRSEKKEKAIKKAVAYREVYTGDPWSSPKAWSKTEIQVTVKK